MTFDPRQPRVYPCKAAYTALKDPIRWASSPNFESDAYGLSLLNHTNA